MRIPVSKPVVAVLCASALLAACSKGGEANGVDANMSDLNTIDSSAGLTNDASVTDTLGSDANTGGTLDNGADATADMGGNAANAM